MMKNNTDNYIIVLWSYMYQQIVQMNMKTKIKIHNLKTTIC